MKDSPIPDLYQKITDESTILGKLASKIPGFSGYVERSRRREADQLLRQTIAGRLEAARLQLASVQQALSRDIIKAIDYAEPMGYTDTRLGGLAGKVSAAPQGYTGFFDAVKIKEEDLANIYAFDEQMLGYVDQIETAVAALDKAVREDGDVGGSLRSLDAASQEANVAFNGRQELLSGVA
ncbi:MAG: hypothetical protein AB1791_22455 [Chloroflexota bacterium]